VNLSRSVLCSTLFPAAIIRKMLDSSGKSSPFLLSSAQFFYLGTEIHNGELILTVEGMTYGERESRGKGLLKVPAKFSLP